MKTLVKILIESKKDKKLCKHWNHAEKLGNLIDEIARVLPRAEFLHVLGEDHEQYGGETRRQMRNKIDKAIDDVHLDHIVLFLLNVVRAFRVQRFHFGLHLFFKCPKQKRVQENGRHQEKDVIKRDINALEDIK